MLFLKRKKPETVQITFKDASEQGLLQDVMDASFIHQLVDIEDTQQIIDEAWAECKTYHAQGIPTETISPIKSRKTDIYNALSSFASDKMAKQQHGVQYVFPVFQGNALTFPSS